MTTVWKFDLPTHGEADLVMPKGAVILSAQAQRGHPQLWALVDTDDVTEVRHFQILLTGKDAGFTLPSPSRRRRDALIVHGRRYEFIATLQLNSGHFVAHLFEVVS